MCITTVSNKLITVSYKTANFIQTHTIYKHKYIFYKMLLSNKLQNSLVKNAIFDLQSSVN